MKVLGLDISKSSATGCLLDERPSKILATWRQIRRSSEYFPKFYANQEGLDLLTKLSPDLVVLEPTGYHYSRIWVKACEYLNILILWVGHVEVANYRKSQKLPNKNDWADAYALACYALEHLGDDEYFLNFSPWPIDEIREWVLRNETVNRIKSPAENRLRQQLAHEFPEAALKESRPGADGKTPLWAWVAGVQRDVRGDYYGKLYDKSIAPILGIEISSLSRELATFLCTCDHWEGQIHQALCRLISHPSFRGYNQVFDQFGFGVILRAWLLVQIYPFSRFQKADGRFDVEFVEGSRMNHSLKSFKLRLGMGQVMHQSGDSTYWTMGGSTYCRKHLFLWVMTRIAPRSRTNIRPQSLTGQQICEYYDSLADGELKSKKMAILRVTRTAAKASTLLFRALSSANRL